MKYFNQYYNKASFTYSVTLRVTEEEEKEEVGMGGRGMEGEGELGERG